MSNTFADLQLIGVEELAQLCGTGKDWIQKGCQARRWEFTLVGRQYRFTVEQTRAIIAAHRVAAAKIPGRDELAERRYDAGRAA